MRLCVLSESPADEAAIRILVEGLCGKQTEPVAAAPLRARGVHSVLPVLEPVISYLHYQTDADALAVVVDSDHKPVHTASHNQAPDPECRLCIMRRTVSQVRTRLKTLANRPSLKIALGLAVPAIEAWYLQGEDSRVGEETWSRSLGTPHLPYTKLDLKHQVYKTERPLLAHVRQCAETAARQLVKNLSALEIAFAGGFGEFAREVRTW
jgi:hypothetical protein